MKEIEMYFLNYKFKIHLDELIYEKFSSFWKDFLNKNNNFDIKYEWNIFFIKSDITKTNINYNNNEIYHYQNSVCELTELNNLLRETIIKISAMNGIVWLHCSGFSINNRSFLVIGNKGYGKTTLLLNAINKGAKFLGNDQLPIFEYNNKIYTYIWRPDIKISMDCASKFKIIKTKGLEENQKVLYLVNNNIPYWFINANKMSERLGKKIIIPDKEIEINMPLNKLVEVNYLIFLDNKQKIVEYKGKNIIDKVKNDPETIFSYKLKNLEKYMPYWNKRIKEIKINKNAYKINKKIISKLMKQSRKLICGNRIEFNEVWNKINKFLEGDM